MEDSPQEKWSSAESQSIFHCVKVNFPSPAISPEAKINPLWRNIKIIQGLKLSLILLLHVQQLLSVMRTSASSANRDAGNRATSCWEPEKVDEIQKFIVCYCCKDAKSPNEKGSELMWAQCLLGTNSDKEKRKSR